MAYRFDLHCHTKEGSKCSDISAKEIAELYHEMGYAGICITDHFTGRNNPLPDDAPWDERVNLFYNIYQETREHGARVGLSVFFGIEYALLPDIDLPSQTTHAHFLFLNLAREWLTENKDAFRENTKVLFNRIRETGGFIIHAHPMHGDELRLFPEHVDAVEIINGRVDDFCNENAKTYAKMYGLLETAGTDIHTFDQKIMTGLETEVPCSTVSELIKEIKEKRAKPFSLAR
jgi:predicted metal-dependent phosphoesterase TrpH